MRIEILKRNPIRPRLEAGWRIETRIKQRDCYSATQDFGAPEIWDTQRLMVPRDIPVAFHNHSLGGANDPCGPPMPAAAGTDLMGGVAGAGCMAPGAR